MGQDARMGARLAAMAPELSARLESLEEDHVRRVVSDAVGAAVAHTGLIDPSVREVLVPGGKEPSSDLRTAVEALAARLDEEAWSIQEHEGESARYVAVFEQARAASAVFFSLSSDVRGSADDALYEAQAALGSVESLRTHTSL